MNDAQITQGEINRYWDFVRDQFQRTGRTAPSPAVLWHYTSGDGLVAIIQSGELWTTQISCVNDSTELRYSTSLLLDVLRPKRMDRELRPHATTTAKAELILYDRAIAGLSVDAAPTSERFVACLSEDGDDLSQWRAYGGGEGGYAIGFDMARLLLTLPQAKAVLAAVCYDKNIQIQIAQAVVDATTRFYLEGLNSRPGAKEEEWAETFLSAWSRLISHIAPAIKHPAFSTERVAAYSPASRNGPAGRKISTTSINVGQTSATPAARFRNRYSAHCLGSGRTFSSQRNLPSECG